MREMELSPDLANGQGLSCPRDDDRPMPYRHAVPLIFGLSIALWILLWQAARLTFGLVFD